MSKFQRLDERFGLDGHPRDWPLVTKLLFALLSLFFIGVIVMAFVTGNARDGVFLILVTGGIAWFMRRQARRG